MLKNFNNKTEKVGDELKKDIKVGSKVNVAAAIFSIYGYESLKAELTLVKSQIEYQKSKELGPTTQFTLFQSKVEEIKRLNENVNELCSKLESYNISDAHCPKAEANK